MFTTVSGRLVNRRTSSRIGSVRSRKGASTISSGIGQVRVEPLPFDPLGVLGVDLEVDRPGLGRFQ